MKYLYGDSSPSPLEINFIQSLRDLVDYGVQVLQGEQQVQAATGRSAERRRASDAELGKLDALLTQLQRSLDEPSKTNPDSPTAKCAAAILRSAADLKREESERARAAFGEIQSKLDAQVVREREACLKALEKMLLKQDLVESKPTLVLQLRSGRYDARVLLSTTYGVEAALDIDIPSSHAFARVVRLDRFAEGLEMEAPEGSWLSRDTKLRPHRFDKYHIVEASISQDQMTLKLRTGADGTGRGFDSKFRRQPPQAMLLRIDDPPRSGDQPFEVKATDLPKFMSLWDGLIAGTAELLRARRGLIQATLDGKILKDHEKPTALLERLISRMAPIAQEIQKRSPSPNELVLKRLLGDDRREEIFVSRDELRRKLEVLTPEQQKVMEPLGFRPAAPAKPQNGTHVDAAAAPEAESPNGQAEVFHKRAIARMKVGEVEAALSDYDRAIAIRPDYAEAYANRAAARQNAGDTNGAVSDLESALRVAPPGWKHRPRVEQQLEGARQLVKPRA